MRRSENVIHNFSSTQKNIFDSLSSSYRFRRIDAIFVHIFKICTIDLLDQVTITFHELKYHISERFVNENELFIAWQRLIL